MALLRVTSSPNLNPSLNLGLNRSPYLSLDLDRNLGLRLKHDLR